MNWNCELSLKQLLSDPLVNAVMAADRVDVRELQEKLNKKTHVLVRTGRPTGFSQAPEFAGQSSGLAGCCC